jgi:hypothetical protein
VATYAKLLSVAGVSVGLTELQHVFLLAIAITISLFASAWRSWRTKRRWPLAIAVTGAAMVLAGHLAAELHALEWLGVLVLLAGGLGEHFRLRELAPSPRGASS